MRTNKGIVKIVGAVTALELAKALLDLPPHVVLYGADQPFEKDKVIMLKFFGEGLPRSTPGLEIEVVQTVGFE